MKKIQRADAIRNILKRLASYLSVCLVIVLGIGGMLTTRYMEAGLDKTTTKYYEDRKFKNYELISSLGVSDASIKKLEAADFVIDAEGVLQVEGSASSKNRKDNITLISLTKKVSVPEVIEGRAPEADNECIIGEDYAETAGLKIGDKLSISLSGLGFSSEGEFAVNEEFTDSMTEAKEKTDADGEKAKEEAKSALVEKELSITGLMRHPDYLRRNAANIVVVPISAFNKDVTNGLYTQAFVRTEQAEGVSPFSDKYFEESEGTKDSLEKLTKQLKEDRTIEVKDKANNQINEAWKSAEEKLENAQSEIDKGEAELNSKLAEGAKKLNDAEALLESTLEEYRRKLRNGEITVPEYNRKLKDLEEELKQARAAVDLAEEVFNKQFTWTAELLENTDKALKENPAKNAPTTETEKKISDSVLKNEVYFRIIQNLGNKEKLKSIVEMFAKDDKEAEQYTKEIEQLDKISESIEILDQYTDTDLKKSFEAIKALDTDALIEESRKIKDSAEKAEYGGTYHYEKKTLTELKNALEGIEDIKGATEDVKKQLETAQAALDKGKKDIEEKIESEAANAREQIDEGWSTYFSEKEKYETKLEEAKSLLEENREKAEKKLAEAKTQVETISCEWIVLDRRGNAGYMDMRSNLQATKSMGGVFGLLFSIITAIVCFSTLVIMIDEQKTLVGTCKAFGFHKREILGKYLVFGLSSAVVGSIFAAIAAYVLTVIVQSKLASSGMYSIGTAESAIVMKPTILAMLMISAVTVAATVIACFDILRSPASLLMKGGVLKKPSKRKKTTGTARKGSLYSRLIIRNMIDDKARVLVSVAVIGFSCILIGLGISMKAAFDGMVNKQISDVNRFDFRIDLNEDVTDEERAAIVDVMNKNGLKYLPATVETKLYVWDDKVDALEMVCADSGKISEFYGVADPDTGEDMSLPENGMLIQKRMHESYGMNAGDKLPILGSDLNVHKLEVKGFFLNYAGRAIVLTPGAYKRAFGEEPANRSYFLRLNGKDKKDIENQLLAVTDSMSIEEDDEFKTRFESAMNLYNLLVVVVTAIAIFISFMILTNLANIYLARKKTELSVMRVNGFSIKQTKAYLVRESIITTAAGIVLGLAVGAIITPILIKTMQQPDLEFVKSFRPFAWISAAGIEAAFAILINYVVFRKVKDLNLRDIAG